MTANDEPIYIYAWTTPSMFKAWSKDPRKRGSSVRYVREDMIPLHRAKKNHKKMLGKKKP